MATDDDRRRGTGNGVTDAAAVAATGTARSFAAATGVTAATAGADASRRGVFGGGFGVVDCTAD